MKIKSLHIDGFGALVNYSLNFNDELNSYFLNNGASFRLIFIVGSKCPPSQRLTEPKETPRKSANSVCVISILLRRILIASE